jgi:signal transduction histidine kinase
VEDDGPGVRSADQEKIFEPFYTTKENGKGTGLGLAVCRTIATSHGGNLSAEPSDDGACFVLEIPAADTASLTALN